MSSTTTTLWKREKPLGKWNILIINKDTGFISANGAVINTWIIDYGMNQSTEYMMAWNDGYLLEIGSLLQIKTEVNRKQSKMLHLGLPNSRARNSNCLLE